MGGLIDIQQKGSCESVIHDHDLLVTKVSLQQYTR